MATADVAASFQKAAVELLVDKARRAARETGATTLCLGGGVAANSLLRERILDVCEEDGLEAFLPSREMCTDNAAMVAAAAWWRYRADGPSPLDIGVNPNLAWSRPESGCATGTDGVAVDRGGTERPRGHAEALGRSAEAPEGLSLASNVRGRGPGIVSTRYQRVLTGGRPSNEPQAP